MIKQSTYTSLYSPLHEEVNVKPSIIPSYGSSDPNSLQEENKRLRDQVSNLNDMVARLSSGRLINSDLIFENQKLKDEISKLKYENTESRNKMSSLEVDIREKTDEVRLLRQNQNAYQFSCSGSSWETTDLKRRIESLEKEVQEKTTRISELERKPAYSISSSYGSQQSADINRLNVILDKCSTVSSRMIDKICVNIPEWRNVSQDTIREIRADVPCSLENVDQILDDLLRQTNGGKLSTNEDVVVSASMQMECDRLKKDLDGSKQLRQQADELYRLVFNTSSYTPCDEQLRSVIAFMRVVLQQLNMSSLQDITREVNGREQNIISLQNELDKYRAGCHLQVNYVYDARIDMTLRDFMVMMDRSIDILVDVLNNSMNEASVALGIEIGPEADLSHFDEYGLHDMVIERFVEYCKRQMELLDTRVRDGTQIISLLIDLVHTQQQKVVDLQTQTTAALDKIVRQPQTVSAPPLSMPTSTQSPVDPYSQREKERQLSVLLRDCQTLITSYTSDLAKRPDRYGIRDSTTTSLLSRLRDALGSSQTSPLSLSQWTASDVLLLLQRIQETEAQRQALQEKHNLLVTDMMSMENERDTARRQLHDSQINLQLKERAANDAIATLREKEDEVARWRTMALNKPITSEYGNVKSIPSYGGETASILSPMIGVQSTMVRTIPHTTQEINEIIESAKRKVLSFKR